MRAFCEVAECPALVDTRHRGIEPGMVCADRTLPWIALRAGGR